MQIPFTEIQLKFYNILSCKGFEVADSIGISFGPCAQAKLVLVLIFFLNAFVRKWGSEEFGMEYSFVGGLIGGLGSFFIAISFIGNLKLALIIGLVCMLLGGFLGSSIFGGEEEYE